MSAKRLGLVLALCILVVQTNAHGSYQVPPSGAPRRDTYNAVPVRQPEQTYGTPPPRTYTTPAPVQEAYEQPKTYTTPAPVQEQPKVYETPPPACPNNGRRHPATGECLVNECETGQHDCDRNAKCIDTIGQSGYFDSSPPEKPGRKCDLPQTNNCASGNHCSPDAICIDTYNGVSCKCKGGFVDVSDDTRSNPGQKCQKIVDHCAKPNICHKDATCHSTFTAAGYYCVCNPGFKDVDPSNPGKECEPIRQSPCSDPTKNDCHKDASCIDDPSVKPEGYTCRCHDGYTDFSPQKDTKPGRVCEKAIEVPISLVIVKDGENATPYSSKYSSPNNKPAVEISDAYIKDLGKTVSETRYGPAYINTTVVKINSPKSVTPSVDDGIIFQSTVFLQPSAAPVNACSFFDAVTDQIQTNGGFVGHGALKVGDDVQKLNPCPKEFCGGKICKAEIGEVCINNQCVINYCSDNYCPANSTCINTPEKAECVCNAGFVNIRNVSLSLRLASGLKEDQYCLRAIDVDWCAWGLHDCHELAICIPLRGNYTCECKNGTTDQNPDNPGRLCLAAAAPIVASPSTLPWWLMLLLAFCCLWALSRLRWFKRRGIMDQTGSSYSDLVIPRPKVRSLDAESMGSGSSEFTIREEIERRVITDVTRTELHTQETEEEVNEHETFDHTTSVNNEHHVR
ncbi:hypothetical protein M3Y97_00571900 [Aphelenchoides bicaudatus]|nr:hypothetical protein M3Y97_00571900 [Aphelenchoides bicaudatus]